MLFQELFALACKGTLTLLIDGDPATGLMSLSVNAHGPQGKLLGALDMTGTPAEFDADFPAAFSSYRHAVVNLRQQAEAAVARIKADAAKPASKPAARLPAPPRAPATTASTSASAAKPASPAPGPAQRDAGGAADCEADYEAETEADSEADTACEAAPAAPVPPAVPAPPVQPDFFV